MYLIRQGPRVCINTPAKLNLFLELHRRRLDGFHELETLMVPVDIYDSLSFERRNDGRIKLSCKWGDGWPREETAQLPAPADNIVYRALTKLQEVAKIGFGAEVGLRKRIPAQAGLGGGSSDAAAALFAANRLWNLNWTREQLAEVAAELGSDVPFFLFNSLARCTGRGEIIEPLRLARRLNCVVVMPTFGLATPEVFRHVEIPATPKSSSTLLGGLENHDPRAIAAGLFNRLQAASAKLTNWIDQVSERFESLGVWGHQLSGSGTSYFAICRNHRHARHVAARLRAMNLGRVLVAASLGPALAH